VLNRALFCTLMACTGDVKESSHDTETTTETTTDETTNTGETTPADDTTTTDETTNADDTATGETEPVLLLIGLMVHLEGHRVDSESDHDDYREAIVAYADLFDAHGAVPTWEVREPIDSCLTYKDPYFRPLEARGHGIGVHADLGGPDMPEGYDVPLFTDDLAGMKSRLESQEVSVRHVSGVCSELDWTAAVAGAGYSFVTGVVDYCLKSLAPVPEEVADCVDPADCHDPYPAELADRLHPWRMDDDNWIDSAADGSVVILPESTTSLPKLASGGDDLSFTDEDIDEYLVQLEAALALVDPEQVNVFFQLWSFGLALDPEVMERWLIAIEPYVASGQVRWVSLPEMYDAFIDWEAAAR